MNNIARILLRLLIGAVILLSVMTGIFLVAYGLVSLALLWPFGATVGEALLTIAFILIVVGASYYVGKDVVK